MGPWSRSFLAAVAGNAERQELEVTELKIEPGLISARVDGCTVELSAAPIPKRTWDAVRRFGAGMGPLDEALKGRTQSVHLEHLLEEDWDVRLIPRATAINRACSCDPAGGCVHELALAHAVAERFDRTPMQLLEWRGIGGAQPVRGTSDPWRGRELAPLGAPRRMPVDAVLKRLAETDLQDLPETLRPAYERLRTAPPAD